MIGTANCVYETPCGWCSKWDKKCNKRIGRITDQISDKHYENREIVSEEMMQKIQEFEKE